MQGMQRQSPVQRLDQRQCTVLLFGRTIKYCVTNIRRKFPTSLSTLSYKTPVFPTDSTLQYHKSNTLALIIKSLNWTLPLPFANVHRHKKVTTFYLAFLG